MKTQGAIEARNLTVVYPGKRPVSAVKDVDFKIAPGEFICLLGPTGCGKSTILNVIAGFIEPTAGEVLLDGHTIQEPGPERGMVFQKHALFPWKTVQGNIEFGPKMKGLPAEERRKAADYYIKMVGLEGFAASYPKTLSGGMEQRVGIARALANDPLALLMDEPFGSLDAQTRIMMQELLLGIWETLHKTIVFVTHDIDEAILLADRLLILTARPGQVRESITVNLPRPRTFEAITSSIFIEVKRAVTQMIREETIKAVSVVSISNYSDSHLRASE
jgi:NitT/TauT family transport system ATP-binding protein